MLRFKKGLLLLALALAACAPAPEEAGPGDAATAAVPPLTLELPAGHQQAAAEITAEFQRQIVATLADDGLEGRGPGTPGDAGARRYLIEQLQALGLEPGGPGGS
ncbi:MAG: aminopeptidase, partial [Thermoanaerobaculia bacterium]